MDTTDALLLHGTLYAIIYGIDKLHTESGCRFNLCDDKDQAVSIFDCYSKFQTVGPGKKTKIFLSQVKRLVLCRPEIVGSKLYATVDLDNARVGRTRTITNEPSHPQWDEFFHIYCAHTVSKVIFTVKDGNPIGATLIGRAYLPVKDIISGYEVEKHIEICNEVHVPIDGNPKIHVRLKFFDVTRDSNWSQGIKTPSFGGVPYTFFMQREGCKVTLYQDAHVPDSTIDKFLLGGKAYESHRCWEDIFDAITNARHLIYITGWSVYTKITLIRDPSRPKPQGDRNLGDLLKSKADEGVRVLMLVWDDRTSREPLKKDGLMATHDQETVDYFRNTDVQCFLCPRNSDNTRSIVQGFKTENMFTHHQKTVVVDSEMPGERSQKRRIVSFIGGIDLCDGRYDTPNHSLFRTLDKIHHDEFHQPNFTGSSIAKGGPREPWHDIHCRLEGPVALDVLYNFEQRWKKQVGNQFLLTLNELDRIITRPPSPIISSEDLETWNVQIFRSIDSGAVEGFPHENRNMSAAEVPERASEIGLVTEKGNTFERSIQDAYINAIRRAKNFIYIENQYFLGSSYGWKPKDDDIAALHLIPKELSLKIVSKIEAGERFTVYVVIPMWPEGIPESESVQAILDWQKRTMEMMYTDIANALQDKGLNANLRDYLTFFCLGNREVKNPGEYEPTEKPDPDTDYSRAQLARRFMIYVHAKMMIVDDEYIIIGSANINQRSMDGARDTEIAMGGYQPHHLAAHQQARGQIFSFRVALWFEHLGYADDSFLHPESLECVQKLNSCADQNWNLYSSNEFDEDLPGHLLKYPVEVSNDGRITALPEFQFFPDTKAPILGKKAGHLPPMLTT